MRGSLGDDETSGQSLTMEQIFPESASSVSDLYSKIEDLAVSLKGQARPPESLTEDSQALKSKLMGVVNHIGEPPSRTAARDLTLEVLTCGMLAGVLDGASLYGSHRLLPQPVFETPHPEVKPLAEVLRSTLDQVLLVGQTSWGNSHVDDLQLLSGYGKHQNLATLEEGEKLATRPHATALDFQGFLLATFKGGYAMGLADAAIVFVGGERPGAPPENAS